MLHSRRYRNRRLGDFLKELDLTEGRSTGIPTIQNELKKNGSPRATIETNEERSFINVFIPVHEGCGDTVILNGTQNGTQGGTQGGTQDLAVFGKWLEEQIKENPKVTTTELALKSGKGIRTIKRYISKLPHIRYVGSGYSGHWEIAE